MSLSTVAERYGRAIFELGLENNQLGDLVGQITDFAATYRQNPELASILENPLIEQPQREAILRDVAARVGLDGVGLNAVRLLAARRKLRALPEIAKKVQKEADRHAGVVRATVTSAAPLADSFYQRLQAELEAAISRRIVLERREDPSLIAGVVTRIGDHTIDGSIRGRLAEIERQLQSF
jgi:F-type H+-transporting ATPase subunit delta